MQLQCGPGYCISPQRRAEGGRGGGWLCVGNRTMGSVSGSWMGLVLNRERIGRRKNGSGSLGGHKNNRRSFDGGGCDTFARDDSSLGGENKFLSGDECKIKTNTEFLLFTLPRVGMTIFRRGARRMTAVRFVDALGCGGRYEGRDLWGKRADGVAVDRAVPGGGA
jgi:hypothetical protein